MDPRPLTKDDVRQILRASEGIPSRVSAAEIRAGRVSPSKTGHALGDHLHSVATSAQPKTKFISMDDMADALLQVLQSGAGVHQLKDLQTGKRERIVAEANRLFAFECELPDAQGRPIFHKVRFSVGEQVKAGWHKTKCVAIVEIRERAQKQHLQIHTFYPAYGEAELKALLAIVRADRA